MLRNHIQFECLDVRQRLRLRQTGDGFDGRVRARTDDDFILMDSAECSIQLSDLQCSGPDEAAGPDDEFHTTLLKDLDMKIDGVGNHPALALTHSGHVDPETVYGDAELLTPAHVRGDLRTVNDIFTRQARDVVARPSDIFALDEGDSLSLRRSCPCGDLRSRAAAEHDQIVPFHVHVIFPCMRDVYGFRRGDNPEIYQPLLQICGNQVTRQNRAELSHRLGRGVEGMGWLRDGSIPLRFQGGVAAPLTKRSRSLAGAD